MKMSGRSPANWRANSHELKFSCRRFERIELDSFNYWKGHTEWHLKLSSSDATHGLQADSLKLSKRKTKRDSGMRKLPPPNTPAVNCEYDHFECQISRSRSGDFVGSNFDQNSLLMICSFKSNHPMKN